MLMTVKQAMQKTGISQSLLYALCGEGRLPHYRIGTGGRRGKVMIDEDDLSAFLSRCRIAGLPPQAPPTAPQQEHRKHTPKDGFIFLPPRQP